MIIDDAYSRFHMSFHLYFTCFFMPISRAFGSLFFLILICRKWPVLAFRDAAVVVFACDRDRVIVDRKLQGPDRNGRTSITAPALLVVSWASYSSLVVPCNC